MNHAGDVGRSRFAVVLPIGPGKSEALDTLESIQCYCPEADAIVLVDDCTTDGTFDALQDAKQSNWRVFRNDRKMGVERLVHSLSRAYRCILSDTDCDVVLRMDQDALIIADGIVGGAVKYTQSHPEVGLFGVYSHDYQRPRSFEMHRRQMERELHPVRALVGLRPAWARLLQQAERKGYRRGDNVFGGAYFITRSCLARMEQIGALDMPHFWHSRLMEDVYFSMSAVAAGFDLGHFGAPEGPLCLEWRGLPYPAEELVRRGYKIIHSVDKGKNTDRFANKGLTAREFFQSLRCAEQVDCKNTHL